MPRRSSIYDLPDDLREALNAKLVATAFRDYRELEAWLGEELEARELELRVSKSALHRHGQRFAQKMEALRVATEQAKALAAGAEDDEGAMSEALLRLVQEKVFTLLMEMEIDPGKVNVSNLIKGIAQITKATVLQKKYTAEVRERAQKAAASVRAEGSRAGLSEDTIRHIEREILGIAA